MNEDCEKSSSIDIYCQKLSKWVNEQRFNMFSQYMTQSFMTNSQNKPSIKRKTDCKKSNETHQSNQNNSNQNFNNQRNNQNETNDSDLDDMPIQGQRYSLPHPFRRMMAEFIDYLILMVVKISIMFLIHGDLSISEILESIDLDFRYIVNKHKLTTGTDNPYASNNAETSGTGGSNSDPLVAASRQSVGGGAAPLNPFESITLDIVYAEIVNRIVVTIYEAICLSGVVRNISATPGKFLMRLRVVQCKDLFDLPLDRVEVLPGGCPGLLCALIRSMIKNFAMVFFLPLCMTALVFNHHRTSYDLIAGTIVVKVPPPRQHRLNMAGLAARNPAAPRPPN